MTYNLPIITDGNEGRTKVQAKGELQVIKGNKRTKKQTTTDNLTTEVQPITDLSTIANLFRRSTVVTR